MNPIEKLKKLAEDLTKEVKCPSCQDGDLFWDEEVQGAVCAICAEQFHNKEYIDLVKSKSAAFGISFTPEEVAKLKRVLIDAPAAHRIAPHVAPLVPRQQSYSNKMEILEFAGIPYSTNEDYDSSREPDELYTQLWEELFNYPEKGYQGVPK